MGWVGNKGKGSLPQFENGGRVTDASSRNRVISGNTPAVAKRFRFENGGQVEEKKQLSSKEKDIERLKWFDEYDDYTAMNRREKKDYDRESNEEGYSMLHHKYKDKFKNFDEFLDSDVSWDKYPVKEKGWRHVDKTDKWFTTYPSAEGYDDDYHTKDLSEEQLIQMELEKEKKLAMLIKMGMIEG